jgi:hypothetical protein
VEDVLHGSLVSLGISCALEVVSGSRRAMEVGNQMDIAEEDKAGVMLWSIYCLPWGLPKCHLLVALDYVTVWLVQCPVSTLLPLATVRNFKAPFTKPFGPVVTQVQVRSC